MGLQSNLGPVDPQVNGLPAHAIREQFLRAYNDISSNPAVAPVWAPMLSKLAPSFLHQCDLAIDYARDFVSRVLAENMLSGEVNPDSKAREVAEALSDLSNNKSHERHFHLRECEEMGLVIERLENAPELQDLVLTVHHCYMHVLSNTNTMKIIENQLGRAMVKNVVS